VRKLFFIVPTLTVTLSGILNSLPLVTPIATATNGVAIPNCKTNTIPAQARETLRNIRAGVEQGTVYNNAGGHGGTRLPSAAKGQEYREYDVGQDRQGNRGQYRFVALVTTGKNNKRVYDPIYYTSDHYVTFCKVI
jgi:guanyl-specific ribonuclease Sa